MIMRIVESPSAIFESDSSCGYNIQGGGQTKDFMINIIDTVPPLTTGILERNFENNIKVYPNPSAGNFNIELSTYKLTDIKVEIMNSLGQLIQTNIIREVSGNIKVPIILEQKGIYITRITKLNSNSTVIKKLIVQ